MKIACDKCGAQFFVDENKLKKDIIHKNCPKCSNPITIRKPHLPEKKEDIGGPSIERPGDYFLGDETKETVKSPEEPSGVPGTAASGGLPSWIEAGVTAQSGPKTVSPLPRAGRGHDDEPLDLTAIVEDERPAVTPAFEPADAPPASGDEEQKVWKVLSADGKTYGPFPISALIQLIEGKRVSGLDRVSKAGSPWEKAFTVPELAIHFSKIRQGAPSLPLEDQPIAGPSYVSPQEMDMKLDSPQFPPAQHFPPPPGRRTSEPAGSRFSIPKISLPKVSLPKVSLPRVSLPAVDVDAFISIGKYIGVVALVVLGGAVFVKFALPLVRSGAHHARDLFTKAPAERNEDLIASYARVLGPVQGTPEDHFQKGVKYFAMNTKEGYLMAEDELKKALALNPQYPQAMATLAETYLRGRDLKADAQHLAEATDLADRSTGVDPKLADGYMVQAYLHEMQGQKEEAKLKALKALELRPDDLGPNYRIGSLLLEEKREQEAAPYLERAAKAKPDFAQVRLDLTSIYGRVGDTKSALPHWRGLVTIDPKNGEWQCGLAEILVKNDLKDEAVKSFIKCVEIVPDNVPARSELVNLLLDVKKKPAEARGHLEILLTQYASHITPQQVNSFHTILGRIYLEGDMPEAAIKEFEAVLAQDSRNADALYYHGEALYRTERFHDAEKEFRTVIQIDPRSARAHVGLGNVLGKFGRLDLAIEEYKAAIGIDPTSSDAHYILGTYYAQRGLTYEAVDSFKSAIKHNPGHLQSHYELGMAAFKVGDNELAIRELKRAKEINPRYEDVSYHLGEVYFADGKIKLAAKEYKDYLSRSPKGTYAEEARKMVRQYGR